MRARLLSAALVAMAAGACGGGDDDGTGGSDGGTDDADGGSTDPAIIFDESTILTYELEVAPADWAYLNEHATEEQYVPATLRLGDEVFEDAALRYKGSYGSLFFCFDAMGNRTCDKLSMKVSFNENDPEGKFHGLKKLNFHSMEADPTRMHDAIGYKLYRDHDVPAPHTAYARVLVNGDLMGLYIVVEQVDGRFTRSTFPEGGEGNLYKEVWPSYLDEQPYLDALETNEDESPSAAKMVRFAQDLADAGEAGFAGVIDDWMEPGQLMRYMAIARLIDSWDDIVAWYCPGGDCFNHNYYWYESTTEDRVWLVAWDIDHTFEEPSPIRTNDGMPDWDDTEASCELMPVFGGFVQGRAPACDPFIRAMATQLWDEYAAESEALLDGDFSLASMNARIDELAALIEDAVYEDPNSPGFAAWEDAVNDLRNIVAAKRDHVSGKL
ncbi:MAG TPA: CotH kinase family protein [Kofleriaceae bacterium]|nr:CotH kinase family protein [Kofleriaceae bacterium]